MTLPDERYRALKAADQFMRDLMDASVTPRVPKHIRDRARSVLRHYPSRWELEQLATAAPSVLESTDPEPEQLHAWIMKSAVAVKNK